MKRKIRQYHISFRKLQVYCFKHTAVAWLGSCPS